MYYIIIFMIAVIILLYAGVLIDLLRRKFPFQKEKLFWFAFIMLVPFLGALIYLYSPKPTIDK